MTRRFSGGPATEVIVELCDLARRAPSAGYSQGTHFLLLADSDRDAFFTVSGAGTWFEKTSPGVIGCSHIVVVLADPDAYTDRYAESDKAEHGLGERDAWFVPYWLTDAAMAAQNLLLLAEDRGLGALFFGLHGDPRATLKHFGVPDRVQTIGAIALGLRAPDDEVTGSPTRRGRRARDAVVHLGRWTNPE